MERSNVIRKLNKEGINCKQSIRKKQIAKQNAITEDLTLVAFLKARVVAIYLQYVSGLQIPKKPSCLSHIL